MPSRAVLCKSPKADKLLYAHGALLINQPGESTASRSKHVITFLDLFKTRAEDASPDFSQVEAALFLTFCFDDEIVQPLLDNGVKLLIAANFSKPFNCTKAPSERPFEVHVAIGQSDSTFHPKLYLIRFKTFLRVVVGSGNLLSADWQVFGNCFYARDFVVLPSRVTAPQSQFQTYLITYLGEVFGDTLSRRLARLDIDLLRYAMDGDCPLLVGSVPGKYTAEGPQHGFPLLHELLQAHPPTRPFAFGDVRTVCLTSSLGSLNAHFLHTLLRCFLPTMPFARKELRAMEPGARRAFIAAFRVVFPTEEYVERAGAAPDCLFLRKATFAGFGFERSALAVYTPAGALHGRENVVPHYKAIIVTFEKDFGIGDDTIIYLGSHNLTKPAWGRPGHNDLTFTVWNFELGVVFPPRVGSAAAKRDMIERLGVAFPPQSYSDFDTPFFNIA